MSKSEFSRETSQEKKLIFGRSLWLEYKVKLLSVSSNISHIRCSGALPAPYMFTDFMEVARQCNTHGRRNGGYRGHMPPPSLKDTGNMPLFG